MAAAGGGGGGFAAAVAAVAAAGGGGGGRGGGGGGRRSDIALKHDVVLLGHLDNGLGFYRFSYLGSHKAYVGVIAQEVQAVMPEAVTRGRDGYLRVYYEKLGVKFQTYRRLARRRRADPHAIEDMTMTRSLETRSDHIRARRPRRDRGPLPCDVAGARPSNPSTVRTRPPPRSRPRSSPARSRTC